MNFDGDPMGSGDTDIQAEGRITQHRVDVSVPAASTPERLRPYRRPAWTELLPWLTISSMCLGGGSIYLPIMVLSQTCESAYSLSDLLARRETREVAQVALLMGCAAVPLGLLGYWLSRREITRIEKELVYPRERPVTIESRRWALIGLVCGLLSIFTGVGILMLG